jgi:hypothetical protein
MLPGYLFDRIGKSCDQVHSRLSEQLREKGRSKSVCVPGDSVPADRVGPWNPGAVE